MARLELHIRHTSSSVIDFFAKGNAGMEFQFCASILIDEDHDHQFLR